ncbi:hypothetical protein ACFSFW_05505 [Fredinandcohnia salidurans]|jgi:hypothetical protein|uniref:Uncharacterized protein n=1 Tax=Fredinandcohnia salidurans TaxID=2595041 RepID=A0ABW4MKJ8_9BACI|nr:hypothetical protein [Fredinandcohnia onubensis]
MKKDEHLKNQVLYITNPAYDALHSENLLEDHDDEIDREQLSLLNREL